MSRSKSRSRSRSQNRKRRIASTSFSTKPSSQSSKVSRTVDPRDIRVGSRVENDKKSGKEKVLRSASSDGEVSSSETRCKARATGGIGHLTTPIHPTAENIASSVSQGVETDSRCKVVDDSPMMDGAVDDLYVIDRGCRGVNALLESTGDCPTPPTGPLDTTTRESSPLDCFMENEETEYSSD
jgi:hypothetical protein